MPVGREILGRISFLGYTYRLAQYSTKATANYENLKKLRAFPFKVTPEEAQKAMSKVAVHLCNNFGLLATLWAALSPSSNFLRPVRFSAAYFPAWIVNAEIEADITYGDARRRGTVIFSNSYLPGSHTPTLSASPFWENGLDYEEPLPSIIQRSLLKDQNELPEKELNIFDPSLLMQHGEEVQCIPFTTSPFCLLDLARNLPWTDAVINENLKFAPSSVKVNLFSAYPVLLPIYIAMYEMKRSGATHGSTLTMWTQAHRNWSTMMSDNFVVKFHDTEMADFISTILGTLVDSSLTPDSEVFSYIPSDAQVKIGAMSFPATKKDATSIERWLQRALGSSTNISRLAGTIHNDDDPRIRPMTLIEKQAMRQYLLNERDIQLVKGMIEELKIAGPNAKVTRIGSDGQRGTCSSEGASAALQTSLDPLLAKKKALMPQWWTEWESIQSQVGLVQHQ